MCFWDSDDWDKNQHDSKHGALKETERGLQCNKIRRLTNSANMKWKYNKMIIIHYASHIIRRPVYNKTPLAWILAVTLIFHRYLFVFLGVEGHSESNWPWPSRDFWNVLYTAQLRGASMIPSYFTELEILASLLHNNCDTSFNNVILLTSSPVRYGLLFQPCVSMSKKRLP